MPPRTRTPSGGDPPLWDMHAILAALKCSRRQVYRLVEAGLMPAPFKVGRRAIRWDRDVITRWISSGCPPVAPGRTEAVRSRPAAGTTNREEVCRA